MRSLQSFLEEDEILAKEITYQEFLNGELRPENSDHPIKKAFEEYKRVAERLKVAKNG